ncbi:MAG: type II secretion system protein [Tepidisphaeraceae bacterium]
MRDRRGFTLLEVLTVVGIVAVLVAILIPTVISVRGAAMQAVCCSRLRDLSLATVSYLQDHRRFPTPGPGLVVPHEIDVDILNGLRPYLKFPRMEPGVAVGDLPLSVQCPRIEEEEDRGPYIGTATVDWYYYTGYGYAGAVGSVPAPPATPPSQLATFSPELLPVIARPERVARGLDGKRAVLWFDDIHFTHDEEGGYWQSSHQKKPKLKSHAKGPKKFTSRDPSITDGQHRAYADGSVEWVEARNLSLQNAIPPLPPIPTSLPLDVGNPNIPSGVSFGVLDSQGRGKFYWWF